MIKIQKFVFNPFQVNTYLLYNDDKQAYLIDPACSEKSEQKLLSGFIDENDLRLKAIVNTHCHIDHILGVEYIRNKYNVEFWCSGEEQFLLDNSVAQGEFFGFKISKPGEPDRYISEEDVLILGDKEIPIFHIPGHSPGSLAFYLKEEEKIITGDVIFSGSIGRTDLPGGDYQTLVTGIRNKLLGLNADVEILPGHGPSSTIGNEKLTNPFLQ